MCAYGGDREIKREHLLCLKSVVSAPVVQVMAHTTYNKRQDLHLCQSLLKARRLIGAEEWRQMKKQTHTPLNENKNTSASYS